ncbi:MAG: uL15m family ribosomal protein [Nanoarchaeota archaeon]
MTHNKRKKGSRKRGSWTHGWGEKKKHRGAGSRGGRGNAGSGKRADVKKPSFRKSNRVFGRHGFVNHGAGPAVKSINVGYFDDASLKGKQGVDFGKVIKVDLEKLGYQKLLGSGKVVGAYEITAASATQSAIKKIEAAGGKVILPESGEE